MTRHLAGRIVSPDDQGHLLPGTPEHRFEIWDDDPDVLVRTYLAGALIGEECLRGDRLDSFDTSLGMDYLRVDSGRDIATLRERALNPFLVPASFRSQMRLIGECEDPAGSEYQGLPGTFERVVIDANTDLLALVIPFAGVDLPPMRLYYECDEQVASAPAPSDWAAWEPQPYTETYVSDATSAATAFGLAALPAIAGWTRRGQMIYVGAHNNGSQAEVWYEDVEGHEMKVARVEETIPAHEAFGPTREGANLRVRIVAPSEYLEFEAPDLESLRAAAEAFRPGISF
jgi:hypothetical protein